MWESDIDNADELSLGAFGMGIVSDDAFAAGAASIPGPFTDDTAELWLVHQYVYQRVLFDTAVGSSVVGHDVTWEIDSKAMRKFTDEQKLVLMAENGNGSFASRA